MVHNFEQSDNSVTGEPRPGRPSFISTKEIETVKELLVSYYDRQMIFRDIIIRTWNTFGTMFRIIHNALGMRRFHAGWIPQKKRPGMLQTAILHHDNDNALSHRAARTTETIKRLGFERLDHPLTHQTWPIEIFFLFPLIKSVLRGTRFEGIADLPVATQQAIAEIPLISF